MMIGHKPNYYWIVCWVALTPLMVAVKTVILRSSAAKLKAQSEQNKTFAMPVFLQLSSETLACSRLRVHL